MAKRKGPRRADRTTTTHGVAATAAQAIEERVGAFAAQLGRIVGTIQVKAESWADREALSRQLVSVRDGATHMLEQLADGMTTATKRKKTAKKRVAAATRAGNTGRSGGVVDAPRKKHRKQPPADPAATRARGQAAKKRTAKATVKTNQRRGRG